MRIPIAFVLLLALGAAQAQDDTLPQADALAPPELDDPGVVTDAGVPVDPAASEPLAQDVPPLEPLQPDPAAETLLLDDRGADAAAASLPGAAAVDEAPLPEKVQAPGAPPPEVTIRTDAQTGDVIEEYRQNGTVYMVRVRPERGPEYLLLDTNGDGRLDASDGEGPVRPVYWTLYQWE